MNVYRDYAKESGDSRPDVTLAFRPCDRHDAIDMKGLTIICLLLALALGAGLFYRHTQASKIEAQRQAEIAELQAKLDDASNQLDRQEQISYILRTNLTRTTEELLAASNNVQTTASELVQTKAQAQAAADAARLAEEKRQAEMAAQEERINNLQSQGDELSLKISGLESTLGSLNSQIADTEAKLAAAEGDREFLLRELKRLQSEKADLERQFNDLALLRAQVSKLKEELSISRRLHWIRMGIYGNAVNKKGAELLMSGIPEPKPDTNFDLNVELRQDGDAKVLPQDSKDTNAPQPAPTPTPTPTPTPVP